MELMSKIKQGGVFDVTLTDIPYDMVNRADNGLRNLNKDKADVITFNLNDFLDEIYRLTCGSIIIFCGVNQVSQIYNYFAEKQNNKQGTVRQLIWKKTNPSPMNGQYIYLSGIENAIWFKKRGATFNAHCKNTVFEFPSGRSKIHPTEKNHELLKDLLLDNSKEDDIIFDPCAGSLAHCLVAKENGRRYVGCELQKEYFDKGIERLKEQK
jgi:DNA modification methylase